MTKPLSTYAQRKIRILLERSRDLAAFPSLVSMVECLLSPSTHLNGSAIGRNASVLASRHGKTLPMMWFGNV